MHQHFLPGCILLLKDYITICVDRLLSNQPAACPQIDLLIRAMLRQNLHKRRRHETSNYIFLKIKAISFNGSIAPVATDPAVPTTKKGISPSFLSFIIFSSSTSTIIRCFASVGIHRIASKPKPKRSAALLIHVCVSAEVYIRHLP